MMMRRRCRADNNFTRGETVSRSTIATVLFHLMYYKLQKYVSYKARNKQSRDLQDKVTFLFNLLIIALRNVKLFITYTYNVDKIYFSILNCHLHTIF